METKDLAVHEHEVQGFDPSKENIALLKNTLGAAKTDLSDAELQLFLYQVKRTALDPLARQIYVMKDRSGKISFITSIDGYRLVAERSGKYLGQTKTEWEFDAEGNLLSATVGVVKMVGDQKDTTYATAWFDEYAKDLDKYYSMWKKMPKTMIAKVAESLALRKAFPQELGGVYTEEEMEQARPAEEVPYNRDDFQPEPTIDIAESEGVTPQAITQLKGALKLKGIIKPAEQTMILTAFAKEFKAETIEDVSLDQSRQIYAQIRVTDTPDLISKMEPF